MRKNAKPWVGSRKPLSKLFFIFFDVQKLSLCANGRQAPAAASVYYKPTRRINPPDGLAKAPRLWASHAATTACARRTTRGH